MAKEKKNPKKEKEKQSPGKAKHKPKVVRDSFTMPKQDYDAIKELKNRCLSQGVAIKKSEILRAGLLLLRELNDTKLAEAMGKVERIKTGRPTNESP